METPEQILDSLRDHVEWTETERDAAFDRMIQSADLDVLETVAVLRLGNLALADGDAVLRLIEAIGSEDVLTALGQALLGQSDLSADRDWHALSILSDAERLGEWPDLAERFAELEEIFEEADTSSLEEWAATMQDDPDGVWVALHGLSMVEPAIRPSIVASLANVPLNDGLIGFLEVLAGGPDQDLRRAAREVLERQDSSPTKRIQVASEAALTRPHTIDRCLVTGLDGEGRGVICIATNRGIARSAIFECDITRGIFSVVGEESLNQDWSQVLSLRPETEYLIDRPELTVSLLAGLVGIAGPDLPSHVTDWLDQLFGQVLTPHPFPGTIEGFDPATVHHGLLPSLAAEVVQACPTWIDQSSLTLELAKELTGKTYQSADPVRDAGAYRYLFEHRLVGRLETYRRMLYWTSAFWNAQERTELAQAALTFAWQLSDAQHSVPANPFVVELTTRSLNAAIGESSLSTPQ